MSTFTCPVVRVASVEDHPNADRLNLVRLDGLGYLCISGKLDDGSPRYKTGDLVVYIPSAAVLPEYLLKEMDFWDTEKNKGTLAGADGNRVKPLRLRGVFSEGILFPTLPMSIPDVCMLDVSVDHDGNDGRPMLRLGEDASQVLCITKYSPPIPVHMAGEVANLFDHTVRYTFERLESVPDIFEPGEQVVATEKLHGTMMAIVYVPGLNHPEMFSKNGDIIVHSKGLGSQGLAFKNNEANAGHLYVRTLQALLDGGFEEALNELRNLAQFKKIALLGEIFGKGVQDLHYDMDKPAFRVFDICVDDTYCNSVEFSILATVLGVDTVPRVYAGPFDLTALEAVRDGQTMLGGANIREGIVVRSATEARHEIHGRKICKMISPDYLTRKSKDATEYT